MAEVATSIDRQYAPGPMPSRPHEDAKTRLLTLDDLDGRTKSAQLARRLRDALVEDLGGENYVTTARATLVQRAATLHAVLEHQEATWLKGGRIDVAIYANASGELRRLLCTLGLDRKPRAVNGLEVLMGEGD
jgi:hypothetical protein